MPRPRTVSDEAILDGVARTIARVGPARLTLAGVAREVGLAPATLLQRFGSKRGLLLALAEQGPATVDACFGAARAEGATPLGAIIIAATHMARLVTSPESLANHLAFLQIDLSDPAFHDLALAQVRATLAGYEVLLAAAVDAGELIPCDVRRLARAIQAMSGGSLINWAIYRTGGVLDWVRADLEALLAPYRRGPAEDSGARAGPRTRHRTQQVNRPGAPFGGRRD